MSLFDKARAARAHADGCTNPSCHRLAHAFESALDAEAREQLQELAPDHSTDGIPPPPVSHIRIPRPSRLN